MYRQHMEDYLEKAFTDYLGCHPTYMIPLIRAHNFIMRDIGPINPAIRYYIAILASSRHRCSFLVNLLKKQFLQNGGNPEWLKSQDNVPDKLQLLNKINKILAHQPWLFKLSHIQNLTKNINSWSLPELTQAIIIMAHFHSLCSLAFGCKFGFEPPDDFTIEDNDCEEVEIEELRFDSNGSRKIKKIVKRSPASKLIVERCRQLEQEDANLAKIMNSFTMTAGKRGYGGGSKNKQQNNNNKSSKAESKNKQQEQDKKEGNQSSNDGSGSSNNNDGSNESQVVKSLSNKASTSKEGCSEQNSQQNNDEFKENKWSEEEWRKNNYDVFLEDPEFKYIDFAKRGCTSETPTYRIQDYQWEDQGYSLSNYLYPDIGSFLDEKFKVAYNLTYYTLGPKTNIDTSPFRRAVWNYIQSIYGIRHDDYNYREVNILLERQLKYYIKHLACYPELTVKHDFRSVMKGFRASEKVHVIIMVAEARLQAEILYALRTLMDSMKLSA